MSEIGDKYVRRKCNGGGGRSTTQPFKGSLVAGNDNGQLHGKPTIDRVTSRGSNVWPTPITFPPPKFSASILTSNLLSPTFWGALLQISRMGKSWMGFCWRSIADFTFENINYVIEWKLATQRIRSRKYTISTLRRRNSNIQWMYFWMKFTQTFVYPYT